MISKLGCTKINDIVLSVELILNFNSEYSKMDISNRYEAGSAAEIIYTTKKIFYK